jgi:deazaflavin-dependent oxidoreductase (nitroreductase family)
MGLQQTLGYRVPTPNALQRLMWKASGSRPGAWMFAKVLHHIDRLVLRLTRGRTTVPELMAGIPVITVVSIGARSGERRELPLLGIPHGDDIALIGTNFGQRRTPAWYFNLRKNPEAEVVYRGHRVSVVAREAEGAEREAIWARGCEIYAGYAAYARRISNRDVHVMVLEAAT